MKFTERLELMLDKKKRRDEEIIKGVIEKLDGRAVINVTKRDSETYVETILGHEGIINYVNGDIVIMCKNHTVFATEATTMKANELLSLGGVNLKGFDKVSGEMVQIVAYYSKRA